MANRISHILVTLGVLLLSGTALAGGPTDTVKSANDTLYTLLKEKPAPGSAAEKALAEDVLKKVRGFLDIEALGKAALADHWGKMSAQEQKQFISLLKQLVEANYIKGMRANLAYKVSYKGEDTRKDGSVVVKTLAESIDPKRKFSIGIDYVLVKDGKSYKAFDVVTDGIGLVENYKIQFGRIIAKEKVSGLLARMEKKAAALAKDQ